MESTSIMIWGLIFGTVGFSFFIYGKKQALMTPLFVGIALMILPYVIENVYALAAIGSILMVIPYFARKQFG